MRSNLSKICIGLGAVLIVAAVALLVYNYQEGTRAEENAKIVLEQLEAAMENSVVSEKVLVPDDTVVAEDAQGNTGSVTEKDTAKLAAMPTVTVDGYEYIGMLDIPSLGIQLPVLSEWSYDGLNFAVGRYSGTISSNDLVICGHNYERYFRQLRNLEVGSMIYFTDVLENVYTYQVIVQETLQPTQISEMTGEAGNDYWDLTLFTCTVGGQARLAVRCVNMDA